MKTRRIRSFAGCVIVISALFSFLTAPAQAVTREQLAQSLLSETSILVDGDTGQILFEKDMHRQMYPASITKVMTAMLALENNDLDDVITMSYDAVFSLGPGASHIALDVDEQLTLEQALYALSIQSANDAANGIAELVGGSLSGFVDMMNERARQVGALNTHFANAHGMPDPNHYTSAYDMAHIMMAAIKTPGFTKFFSEKYFELQPTNKQEESRYFWRSKQLLIGEHAYEGCFAEKTGWTESSGYTYVTAVRRNGVTLIAVVMNAPKPVDKLTDATALLDYGFDEFHTVRFSADELSQQTHSFVDRDGNELEATLTSETEFVCHLPKSLSKHDVDVDLIATGDPPNADGSYSVTAVFSLPVVYKSLMPTALGELPVTAHPILPEPEVTPSPSPRIADDEQAPDDAETSPDADVWAQILLWFIRVALGALAILAILIVRRFLIIKLRRRRRRHQRGNGSPMG